MNRDHEWNAVVQLRQDPAKVAVPSVTVNKVSIDVRGIEVDAATDRAENGAQRCGTSEPAGVDVEIKV